MAKDGDGIKVKAKDGRNEMHFEIQLKTRSRTFVDRKRRMKGGYSKHKGAEDDDGG